MNRRIVRATLSFLGLGGALALIGRARQAEAVELPVVRTLVYRELKVPPFTYAGQSHPVLGHLGGEALFARSPGTQSPANPIRIYDMFTTDGHTVEADAYPALCPCFPLLDFSVLDSISSDGVQLRLGSIGADQRELAVLNSRAIADARVTEFKVGDQEVVFVVNTNTTMGTDQKPIERGVWAIGTRGTGLRQVVGPAQVARALGVAVETLPGDFTDLTVRTLGISGDGTTVVFMSVLPDGRHQIFAVTPSGGDPRPLLPQPAAKVLKAGLSADGSTAFFKVFRPDEGHSVGVIGVDGSNFKVVATDVDVPGLEDPGDTLQVTHDGGALLLGSSGLLYPVAGNEPPLSLSSASPGENPWPLAAALFRPTMDESARRFLYIAVDPQTGEFEPEHTYLALLELDPQQPPAEAPRISQVLVEEAQDIIGARVDTNATQVNVHVVSFDPGKGREDQIVTPTLLDDGNPPDTKAGDKFYTGALGVPSDAPRAPHILRIKAEIVDAGSRRWATAVDTGEITLGMMP